MLQKAWMLMLSDAHKGELIRYCCPRESTEGSGLQRNTDATLWKSGRLWSSEISPGTHSLHLHSQIKRGMFTCNAHGCILWSAHTHASAENSNWGCCVSEVCATITEHHCAACCNLCALDWYALKCNTLCILFKICQAASHSFCFLMYQRLCYVDTPL